MTRKHKPARWIVLGAALALAGLLAWRISGLMAPAKNRPHMANSMEVDALRVTPQAVPLVLHAAGVVKTHHSVAVRAQVGGILQKVLFNEGDEVKAGQLLFVIDPEPYEVQVQQAKGKVEQDKAKLASDNANAERSARLVKQGYVSSQDNQNAAALVLQDKGTLAADEASLEQAQLQLQYTHIHAPISGKTGSLSYKAGNLIQSSDTTPLVTINQIAPILVQFDIPQSEIATLQHHLHDPSLNIYVRASDGSLIANGGKLVFIDNTVNQDSGTLTLKAEFHNRKEALWPGELVHVSMQLTVQPNAIVIPDTAVQPGQEGNYVYVVDSGKVKVRNVTVQRQYQGYSVISHGLDAGAEVVVHIPRDLREGIAVRTHLLPAIDIADSSVSSTSTAPNASS